MWVIFHTEWAILWIKASFICRLTVHTCRKTQSPVTAPREIMFSATGPWPWPSDIHRSLSVFPISFAKQWNASNGSDPVLSKNTIGMTVDVSWYLTPKYKSHNLLHMNINHFKKLKSTTIFKEPNYWVLFTHTEYFRTSCPTISSLYLRPVVIPEHHMNRGTIL